MLSLGGKIQGMWFEISCCDHSMPVSCLSMGGDTVVWGVKGGQETERAETAGAVCQSV